MNVIKFCTHTAPDGTWCRLVDFGAITTQFSSFHASKMRLGNPFNASASISISIIIISIIIILIIISIIHQHLRLIWKFRQKTFSALIFRLSKELNCKLTSSLNNILTFEHCELRNIDIIIWRQQLTKSTGSEMFSF